MKQLLDLNDVRIFVKVMETRSFTDAAKVLGIPKSKVSRAISALEDVLRTPLLYRTTRQVEPTSAGLQVFGHCHAGLANLEAGLRSALDESRQLEGSLRLTALEDMGVHLITPLVAKFCQLYPKLKLELIYGTPVLDLVKESIDLAVRVGKSAPQSYRVRKVGTVCFVLAASPRYLERFAELPTIDSIAQGECLSFSGFEVKKHGLVLCRRAERRRVDMNVKLESSSTTALLQLALDAHGIALLPDFMCAEPFKKGLLQPVCGDWSTAVKVVSIVMPARIGKEAPAQLLSNFLFKHLSEIFTPL